MQGRPENQRCRWSAVQRISQNRESDGKQVSANLVRPTGFWLCFQQSITGKTFEDTESGLGRLAAPAVHDGALGMSNAAPQRVMGNTPLPGWLPTHQGVIHFNDRPRLECSIQRPVRFGVASENKDAAGDFIQAMHNPEPPPIRL